MNTSKWTLVAAVAAIFSTANAAGPDDVMLSHYEPLQQLTLHAASSAAANASQKPGGAAPLIMSFDALGRSFDLELEPNSRLVSVARQNSLLDGVDIYRGELAGRPGSWARIVVADGVPQGMFWDGQEMFAIEAPGDSVHRRSRGRRRPCRDTFRSSRSRGCDPCACASRWPRDDSWSS